MEEMPRPIYLRFMRRVHPLVLAIPVALAVSCSQRVSTEEEFARSERDRPLISADEARLPPPAGIAAGGGGMAGRGGMAGGGGVARDPSSNAADPTQTIRGTIAAPPEASDGILFLFVRAAGASGGPPLAVQRIPTPAFPLEFAIGPQDAMIAGGPFPARVTVEARLDSDGNAMTEGPGDVSARVETAPGATDVDLTLGP